MAKILDFALNLSMLLSGDFKPQALQVLKTIDALQKKTSEIQKVSGQISGYQKQQEALSQNQERIQSLQQQYQAVTQQISQNRQEQYQIGQSYAFAQSRVDTLKNAIASSKSEYDSARARVQALKTAISATTSPSSELKAQYSAAVIEARRLGQSHRELSSKYRLAKTRASELARQYQTSKKQGEDLTLQQEKLSAKSDKLSESLTRDSESLSSLQTKLQSAGVNTNNLADSQRRLDSQLEQTRQSQERLSQAQAKYTQLRQSLDWGNIKGQVLTALGGIGAIKAPVKLAADFEAQMARVKSVAFTNEGADMSEFEALRKQALQLGADTQFTAIEAAGAQENLARSGMKTSDILAAMPSVLNMSAAEGMSIQDAGAIIAKGLGGMGLEGKYAGRLADILAYTSANSNTNIAMLGEAFKASAPIASSQNISMEQLASYLGVLANKGYEGSEAGHALSSSLQRLAKRPREADQALTELGVATRTREGKMRELPDILTALNEAMKARNLGENQQLAYMSKIFGSNYGGQMMSMMQASTTGETERMQSGVYNNSFGRSQVMANINLDTLNGQLTLLSSAWDGLRTKIGDIFSPYIRKGVELLTGALSSLNDIMQKFPTLTKTVLLGFAGFSTLKVASVISNIGNTILQLPFSWLKLRLAEGQASALLTGEKFSLLGSLFSPLSGILSRVGGAFTALWGVISAHPLMALIVAFELIYHNWDSLRALAGKASTYVLDKWQEVKEWWNDFSFKDVFTPIYEKAIEICNMALEPFQWLANKIMDMFAKLNPFNWEVPSWLGGGKANTAQVNANAQAALGGYTPPEIRNAKGGIYTRPIWTWAAEDGAEAIIPLTDKARGIPLVMQAAQALGLTPDTPSRTTSMPSLSAQALSIPQAQTSGNAPASVNINITVNASGQTEQDLPSRIANAVREALGEYMSIEERVSYA